MASRNTPSERLVAVNPILRRSRPTGMSLLRFCFAFSLAAPCVVVPAVARAQQSVRLARPTATLAEAFSNITDVVELTNGRVIVADDKDQRLVIIDLASGSVRGLGRVGAGPGEFRAVGRLLPRPGGVFLTDFAQRRLLPVNDDGTFATPITFPVSILISATDSRGYLYGDAFVPGLASDSMLILRWDPGSQRVDSIGAYDAAVTKWTGPRTAKRPAYAAQDAFIPLADGSVAIVHGSPYGVSVRRNGRVSERRAIPVDPIRVTDADRSVFLQRVASQPVRSLGGNNAPSSGRPMPTFEFPPFFPPFGGQGLGGLYVRRAANGDLWVERMRSERDSVPLYDVIDAVNGRLLMRVTLPPRTHVVGFGSTSVYLAQRDEDDFAYVRRYAYPSTR
jgi:hypothetical protein